MKVKVGDHVTFGYCGREISGICVGIKDYGWHENQNVVLVEHTDPDCVNLWWEHDLQMHFDIPLFVKRETRNY